LDGLRRNGSLLRVLWNPVEFVEAPSGRWQNYLTRNELVPAMLADGDLDRSLFPTLFQVAKSMPAMAANMILVGLLTASSDGSTGPSMGDKRTRAPLEHERAN
jgi:hypothetical protein